MIEELPRECQQVLAENNSRDAGRDCSDGNGISFEMKLDDFLKEKVNLQIYDGWRTSAANFFPDALQFFILLHKQYEFVIANQDKPTFIVQHLANLLPDKKQLCLFVRLLAHLLYFRNRVPAPPYNPASAKFVADNPDIAKAIVEQARLAGLNDFDLLQSLTPQGYKAMHPDGFRPLLRRSSEVEQCADFLLAEFYELRPTAFPLPAEQEIIMYQSDKVFDRELDAVTTLSSKVAYIKKTIVQYVGQYGDVTRHPEKRVRDFLLYLQHLLETNELLLEIEQTPKQSIAAPSENVNANNLQILTNAYRRAEQKRNGLKVRQSDLLAELTKHFSGKSALYKRLKDCGLSGIKELQQLVELNKK